MRDERAEIAFKNISRVMEMHGLMGDVSVVLKTADRFFFHASPAFYRKLLSLGFSKTSFSGGPHNMVFQLFPEVKDWGPQVSYRSLERPSLQVTVAYGDGRFLGDADLDLGNPLMDVLGAATHMIELVIPGKTSHKKLEGKISRRFEEWKSRQREGEGK